MAMARIGASPSLFIYVLLITSKNLWERTEQEKDKMYASISLSESTNSAIKRDK